MIDNDENLTKLPKGWAWTQIGEIARLVRGVNYKKQEASGVTKESYLPILRANNINSKIIFDELVYVPCERISPEQFVEPLDIVLAMSSGSKDLVGKAAQSVSSFGGGFGAFCGLVRPSGLLNGKLIGYFFHSPNYRRAISLLSSGVNINNLRREHIETMPIPLAPLNEQKRIVAKIEELFTRLDAGVEALKKVKAELKRYRQTVLKATFEGRLTAEWRGKNKDKLEPASKLLEQIAKEREKSVKGKTKKLPVLDTSELPELPDGWEWILGDMLFLFITSGSRGWAKYYSDAGAIFLRVGNLDHCSVKLDLSDIQHVRPPATVEVKRTRVLPGDILISVTADVGMTALVPDKISEAYVNQHVALVRSVTLTNREFVSWYIASPEGGQRQFSKLQRGATKAGLGLDDIRSLAIPIPCLFEQAQIVSEIERHFSIADEVEQTIERSLKEADRLRQSILKRAFEGKLVPQDPSDEPAEKLLERIKKQKRFC